MRRAAKISRDSFSLGWLTKAPLSGTIWISLSLERISSAARILVRLTEYRRDKASSRSLVPGGSLRAAMASAMWFAMSFELSPLLCFSSMATMDVCMEP
jgi:hypothetical protein